MYSLRWYHIIRGGARDLAGGGCPASFLFSLSLYFVACQLRSKGFNMKWGSWELRFQLRRHRNGLVNEKDMLWNVWQWKRYALERLARREKGVLRAAHTYTVIIRDCPPWNIAPSLVPRSRACHKHCGLGTPGKQPCDKWSSPPVAN